MEEYTEILKSYLGYKRSYTKVMFKLAGRIYRGTKNNRFTFEQVIQFLDKQQSK